MFYIVNLGIILATSYLTKRNKTQKGNRFFLFASWLQLILIMGLRKSTVGTDSQSYIFLFKTIVNGGTTILSEKAPLFTFLLRLTGKIFGDTDQVYFFLTGSLIVTFVLIAIKKSGIDLQKGVLLYYVMFFLPSLNGTRNYLAVSMLFAAFFLLKSKYKVDRICAFLLTIASIFIHSTAIIGIPIMIISNIDLSVKKKRRFFQIGTIILLFVYRFLIDLFISFFPVYANTIDEVTDSVGASAIVFQLAILVCYVQAVFIRKALLYEKGSISFKFFNSLMFLIWVELCLFILGGNTWYIQRFIIYFEILSVPLFINNCMIKSKYRLIFRIMFDVIVMFCFIYSIFRNLGDVSPYMFFWQ